MPTRQQNALASAKAKNTQEHHALEIERLKQAEVQRTKREKEKKTRDVVRKQEEEARKRAEDTANDQEYSISTSTLTLMEVQESNLVSPTDGNKEGSQPNLNLLLQQGGRDDEMDFEPLTNDLLSSSEDEDQERSPAKKKGKKRATFSGELTRSNHPVERSKNTAQTNPEIPQDKTTTKQPKPTSKAPKPAFKSPPPTFTPTRASSLKQ